jgi:hypothetical protein
MSNQQMTENTTQPRDREAGRAIHRALLELPLPERQSALMFSIIEGNPGAMEAIIAFVRVSTIMARFGSPDQRAQIAAVMHEEADALVRALQ